MSLFTPTELSCPHCSKPVHFEVCASVNADRRPDLRTAILDGSFQQTTCPHCSQDFRLEPQLNYLDVGRGQWIAAFPRQKLDGWQAVEAEAQASFDKAYGPQASAAERELGDSLKVRVVFSWDALREKLLAFEAGLDDVRLEQLKLMLMREMDEPPLPIGAELRLTGLNADTNELMIAVLDRDGSLLEELDVPRELIGDIEQDQDGWAALTQELGGGAFVDLQRLTRGA